MKTKINATIAVSNVVLIILSLAAVLPFLLMIISSITDDMTLIRNGYSFIPEKISFKAYEYLWLKKDILIKGYGITIFITVVGTILSLFMTSMLAYALAHKGFPWRKTLSFMVLFTMLFNGGLVPTYFLYSNYLGIKNTLLALLVPGLLMRGFNVLIMRSYFSNNIPDEVLESSYIDGAGELRTFFKIVFPLSYPILATVGLLVAVSYWNDWYNGMIFLTDTRLYNIQNILNRMLTEIRFLATTNVGSDISAAITTKMPTVSIRMAIASIVVIPLLIIYFAFQKYFIKGITVGSIK